MKTSWFALLFPPRFPSYEQTQKSKLLHYMLLSAFLGGLIFGSVNFLKGWHSETIFLFLFAGLSLFGFYLNRTRFVKIAALILCGSLFVLLSLLMYNGVGLYDETVLAFPLFLIFTAFLLGRRGLWIATFLSIAAVVTIHLLQVYGFFENRYPVSFTRVFGISFMLAITTLTIGAVRGSWEMNLHHLHESYDLTLRGWARALEYRDGETAGHTRRVAEMSVTLARKLGLSGEELRGIERGAYLHDIGKMAIPDKILLKPGPLTRKEWEFMRQHPARSREFISEIPYLQPAVQVAYSHHEHWDGSGYPDGLQGEEIPLGARVFTVIDNWDALNSDRPYRQAWPREKVIAYLQENSGSIFDPKIVEAFLEIIEQHK